MPPPSLNGIGFVDNRFNFAGVTFTPPPPGIALADSGLTLTRIGAGIGLTPTRFDGSIGLTAADVITIDGAMFMAFASPSQPCPDPVTAPATAARHPAARHR